MLLLLLLLLVLLLLLLLLLVVVVVVVFAAAVVVGFGCWWCCCCCCLCCFCCCYCWVLAICSINPYGQWSANVESKIHSRSDHRIHLICVASLGQPVVSVDATNVFSITQLRHYHSLIGVNQLRTNINTVVSCMVVWHLRPIWQRLYIFIATRVYADYSMLKPLRSRLFASEQP